jgi:CheY-like chemotaxis protein
MRKLILVAEDEQHIRDDISRILQIHDYETLTAVNGREALRLAKQEIPDLIISDVMMPDMDGYALLDELQKEPRTVSIPFFFLRLNPKELTLDSACNWVQMIISLSHLSSKN